MRETVGLAGSEKIELLARTLERRVSVLPAVMHVRQSGLVVAIELGRDPYGQEMAGLVARAAHRRGASVGVGGNVVVLKPPPSISESELCRLVAILASSIAEVASSSHCGCRLEAARTEASTEEEDPQPADALAVGPRDLRKRQARAQLDAKQRRRDPEVVGDCP